MDICIIATASAYRGALMIYKQFLDALKMYKGDNNWHIFVDYDMPLPKIEHVNYHICHTKGFGRIWFDIVGFSREVKRLKIVPDVIVSLQNTGVYCHCERIVVYYHQSLPLYHYKFKLLEKAAFSNLFYSYFYPLYVRLFLNKRTFIAVQTNTIKKLFSEKFGFPKDKIGVYFPKVEKIDTMSVMPYQYDEGTYNFLYPSMGASYKEHITLPLAIKILKERNPELVNKIRIHFTVDKNVMKDVWSYIVHNDLKFNFVFHGNIPHKQVMSMLKGSNGLLFPSVVESSGLPLLEASMLGVPVIANDMGYVHDALKDYEGVKCVQVHNYEDWAEKIISFCFHKEDYCPYSFNDNNSWGRLFRLIKEGVVE